MTTSVGSVEFDPNLQILAAAFSEIPAVFTKDSRNIICAAPDVLFEHSTSTGLATLKYSFVKHASSPIVWIERSIQEDALIVLVGDGTLCWWNAKTRAILKRSKITLPSKETIEFTGFVVALDPRSNEENIFATAKSSKDSSVILLHFIPSSNETKCCLDLPVRESEIEKISIGMAYLACFDSVVMSYGASLCVFSLHNGQSFCHEHKHKITTLTVDVDSLLIAFGDQKGAIFVFPYEAIAANTVPRQMQKLHWHYTAVSCLLFTGNNQLTSGGIEGVLVTWNLNTGSKHFIPRLNGRITTLSLSSDGMMLAVGLSSNTISLYSTASMSPIQSIHSFGLLGDLNKSNLESFSIVHRPESDMVVLPSTKGKIQFYNSYTNNHAFFQDIVGHNEITSNIVDGIGHDSVIIFVAFSPDGNLMITVERRIVANVKQDTMKCWLYSVDKSHFVLHSIMDSPHIGGITGITFALTALFASDYVMATGGFDNCIRLWIFKDNRWTCNFSRSYKQMTPSVMRFSADSSVLCVAVQRTAIFWSTQTMSLIGVHACPPEKEDSHPIQSIEFFSGTPLVGFSTRNVVFIYNMFTLRICWRKYFAFSCIQLFHLRGDAFVLVTGNQEKTGIFVFNATSADPIRFFKLDSQLAYPTVLEANNESGLLKLIAYKAQPKPRIVTMELPLTLSTPTICADSIIEETPVSEKQPNGEQTEDPFRNLFGHYEMHKGQSHLQTGYTTNFNPLKSLELGNISSLALPPAKQLCDLFFSVLFINKS